MTRLNRWWIVLGSVFGLLVGNGPIMQFTFGVFLLPITKEFGWSRSTTSAALVVGLAMTGICVPLAGRLIDRFGIRRVTLPAIVLFSLCLASIGQFAHSPAAFVGIYALMGVAAAGQTPLPYAKAIAMWFDSKRGLALGLAMSGVGLGAALIPQFTQYAIANFGWRDAYLALAAVVFLIGFSAVGLAVREPAVRTGSSANMSRLLPGLTGRQALGSVLFWKLAIVFFCVALATNGAVAHVVPLLIDRGIAPALAASAMAFAGMALTGGRLLAGYFLDRVFAPYISVVFFLMPLAGIGILLANTSPQYVAFAIVLIGMGLGAEVDLIAFLSSRYLGMKSFGEIYGYLFAIFMLGSGVGPYVMGLSFDKAGSYTPALIGLGGCLVIACLLLLRLGAYVFPHGVEAGGKSGESIPGIAVH
jgi:MFS family permease